MFDLIKKIGQQVANHSTILGQVWYLMVYGFRLFVISTIAASVYEDELDFFSCSENVAGCNLMCYDEFTKISHNKFWAFQMVAVSIPTLIFHLYVKYTSIQINKIKSYEQSDQDESTDISTKIKQNVEKRKQKLGPYKIKKVFRGDNVVDIPQSRRLMVANILNLIARLSIEIFFIYLGSYIFNIKNGRRQSALSFLDYVWMKVPGFYICTGENEDVRTACRPNLMKSTDHVPCWVARPYEKTVLLRYMNITSVICAFLTVVEIISILSRAYRHRRKTIVCKSPSCLHRNDAFNNNGSDMLYV